MKRLEEILDFCNQKVSQNDNSRTQPGFRFKEIFEAFVKHPNVQPRQYITDISFTKDEKNYHKGIIKFSFISFGDLEHSIILTRNDYVSFESEDPYKSFNFYLHAGIMLVIKGITSEYHLIDFLHKHKDTFVPKFYDVLNKLYKQYLELSQISLMENKVIQSEETWNEEKEQEHTFYSINNDHYIYCSFRERLHNGKLKSRILTIGLDPRRSSKFELNVEIPKDLTSGRYAMIHLPLHPL